jgi:hypothetical protein
LKGAVAVAGKQRYAAGCEEDEVSVAVAADLLKGASSDGAGLADGESSFAVAEQDGGCGAAEGEVDIDAIVAGASGEGEEAIVGRWIEGQARRT